MRPEVQAERLIQEHLEVAKDQLVLDPLIIKQHAIISANLIRKEFILAPRIGFWDNVIKAIKAYKFKQDGLQ